MVCRDWPALRRPFPLLAPEGRRLPSLARTSKMIHINMIRILRAMSSTALTR